MGAAMSEALPKDTRIAGFVIEEPLGRGGFGITYRARSDQGGRIYAIKEYFPADFARRNRQGHVVATDQPQAAQLFEMGRAAFLEEAYILRDLPRQPGLVRVRSAFEKHNTAYCVTDFIDGDTLDRVAARIRDQRGHIPETHILTLIATLCQALAAVHGAGFIHRDIKPGNVMISRDGAPVLIDFGAARAHGEGQTRTSMLSRRYAALEQFPQARQKVGGGLREGPWTDIYALSVMIYELMTQSLPPPAETRYADLRARRPDPYLPVRVMLRNNRVSCTYSGILLDAVDSGCALMPDDRPRSVTEFRRRLLAILPDPANDLRISRPKSRPAVPIRPDLTGGPAHRPAGDGQKILLMLALIVGLALAAALVALRG